MMDVATVWAMLGFWFAHQVDEVLPECRLQVAEHPKGRDVNGWCDCTVWPPIVALCPDVVKDSEAVIGTLAHEACHVLLHFQGELDVFGQLHTKRFKALAEQVGLVVEFNPLWGWGVTAPSEQLLEFCGVKAVTGGV